MANHLIPFFVGQVPTVLCLLVVKNFDVWLHIPKQYLFEPGRSIS